MAHVETDWGVSFPGKVAEDRQLESHVLVTDVLDDDLDARLAAGVGDPSELVSGRLPEVDVVAVGRSRVEDRFLRAEVARGG